MRNFSPLTVKELTLISRVALNPGLHQVELARTLNVSRSAVNQIWKRLVRDREFCVKSLVNYGKFGIHWLFGWAEGTIIDPQFDKFIKWLTLIPYTIHVTESILSSLMNRIVYFEALAPSGEAISQLTQQLNRFRKRPYDIAIDYDYVDHTSDALNLSMFDGTKWDIEDGFKFGTIMSATKSFADILPIEKTLRMGHKCAHATELAIAAILQQDYHTSSRKMQKILIDKYEIEISSRTLRRRLPQIRSSLVMPYVSISQIGLTQTVLFCFRFNEMPTNMIQFLHAQTNLFSKTRTLFGSRLAALRIQLPSNVNWLAMAESFIHNLKGASDVTACICDKPLLRKELEHVFPYFVKHKDNDVQT